jgi:DNA-binding MarR family transcriptional regulator
MLAEEIHKKHPFALQEEEAYLNLWRTLEYLSRRIDQCLRLRGLSRASYNVLRIVHAAGEEGTCTRAIGCQLVAHGPDITRLVDRLCTSGLASRAQRPGDRRVVLVRCTAKGAALLASIRPQLEALHKDLLGHMSAGELAQLSALLERARQAPAQPCPGAASAKRKRPNAAHGRGKKVADAQ